MPTEGCSVCMPIAITNFKVRGIMKVVLTNIPVKCGVVDPNVYCFLDSCD